MNYLIRALSHRFSDVSVAVGGCCWFVFLLLSERIADSTERLLVLVIALALLVLVPFVVRFAHLPSRDDSSDSLYSAITIAQLPSGLLAVSSLFLPVGVFAAFASVPWLLVTAALGCYGLRRVLFHGTRPLSALAVSVGLLYLPVGGVALIVHRSGLAVGFTPTIVLLTVVHFHFAGSILPVFVGLTGRLQPEISNRRRYLTMLVSILSGPALIAIGITFSPFVEVVGAGTLAGAVVLFAVYFSFDILPKIESMLARGLLTCSAVSIVLSMGYAAGYAVSRFYSTSWITISEMLYAHGLLNAFGFGLLGMVGWRIVDPESQAPPFGIPISSLTAKGRVGADYIDRIGARAKAPKSDTTGMVDTFDTFSDQGFDASQVHPDVRTFYERTADFDLVIYPSWRYGFRTLARLYQAVAVRVEQMNFPLSAREPASLTSRIVPIADDKDGRSNVRAWIRVFEETERALYVAAYSLHSSGEETYMNIAFPLPMTNLTSVLRITTLDDSEPTGVELTTKSAERIGDEGIYLRTPICPVRIPMNETIRVWPSVSTEKTPADSPEATKETSVSARHRIYLFGINFLTLDYHIVHAENCTVTRNRERASASPNRC